MAVILKTTNPKAVYNEIVKLEKHNVYCWAGNGEFAKDVSENWIRNKETKTKNANRVIDQYKKNKKYANCRLFDCSGFIVCLLRILGVFSPTTDINANGFKGWCSQISKAQLQDGDFVFKIYTTELAAKKNNKHKGDAYHIGFYYGGKIYSSRGRDYDEYYVGEGGWNWYGRPKNLYTEQPSPKGTAITGTLKKSSKYSIQNVALQDALIECGYSCGKKKNNGYFGNDTENAVRNFQKRYPECGDSKGKPDGHAGKKTINKLAALTKGILYWAG